MLRMRDGSEVRVLTKVVDAIEYMVSRGVNLHKISYGQIWDWGHEFILRIEGCSCPPPVPMSDVQRRESVVYAALVQKNQEVRAELAVAQHEIAKWKGTEAALLRDQNYVVSCLGLAEDKPRESEAPAPPAPDPASLLAEQESEFDKQEAAIEALVHTDSAPTAEQKPKLAKQDAIAEALAQTPGLHREPKPSDRPELAANGQQPEPAAKEGQPDGQRAMQIAGRAARQARASKPVLMPEPEAEPEPEPEPDAVTKLDVPDSVLPCSHAMQGSRAIRLKLFRKLLFFFKLLDNVVHESEGHLATSLRDLAFTDTRTHLLVEICLNALPKGRPVLAGNLVQCRIEERAKPLASAFLIYGFPLGLSRMSRADVGVVAGWFLPLVEQGIENALVPSTVSPPGRKIPLAR